MSDTWEGLMGTPVLPVLIKVSLFKQQLSGSLQFRIRSAKTVDWHVGFEIKP